jgi:hypothetical protein
MKAQGDSMEIVFVHFGPKYPKHLILNLKRTCELFPGFTVVLITDAPEKLEIRKDNFRISHFAMNNEYEILNEQLNHPKDFRNNFWFTSLARIYALCDYVASNNVPILHIESDVLVSGDLPINRFAMCDRPIAFTVVGKRSGVASIMWIKNAQAASHLRVYAAKSAEKDQMTTDMKILGQYQEDFPQRVRVLASFPTENASSYKSISSQLVEDFTYTKNLFDGLFDAADVGRYLLGDDPRNHRGIKLLRKQLATSYFSPREVRYVYSETRKFLNTASGSQNRFYSLHIHSKDSDVFKEKRIQAVFLRAIRDQDKPEGRILVLSVLIKSIKVSVMRRANSLVAGQK